MLFGFSISRPKKCPRCKAIAYGNTCKVCFSPIGFTEVFPILSFDDSRHYLEKVVKWGKPGNPVIRDTDGFVIPWHDGVVDEVFIANGIKYKFTSESITFGTKCYECSVLIFWHPVFGKCKIIHCITDSDHYFHRRFYDRNRIGKPYGLISNINDIAQREAIKDAVIAICAWFQYKEKGKLYAAKI